MLRNERKVARPLEATVPRNGVFLLRRLLLGCICEFREPSVLNDYSKVSCEYILVFNQWTAATFTVGRLNNSFFFQVRLNGETSVGT